MAVVTTLSDLIHDPYVPASVPPDPQQARGAYRASTGTVANLSSNSTGSVFHLADVPADALIHEDTFFHVQSWGFAQVVIGTETDTDALVDVAKSAGNTHSPFAVGGATHGKRWWEVLGFAASPKGMIRICAHAEGNATGAGSLKFRIAYLAA